MSDLTNKKISQNTNPDEEIINNLELLINMDVLEESDIWDDLVVLKTDKDSADTLESEK